MRIHCHEDRVTLKPTSTFSISSPTVALKVQKKRQKTLACAWRLMSSTLWLSEVTLGPSSALKGPACLQCQRGQCWGPPSLRFGSKSGSGAPNSQCLVCAGAFKEEHICDSEVLLFFFFLAVLWSFGFLSTLQGLVVLKGPGNANSVSIIFLLYR